jgi:aminoglycoside phosphotransferase (APT) family kinase protein
MTKDGSFKKVVRRHAQETDQRYTEALTDLEDLESRIFHEPVADRLILHLQDRYDIDAVAATKASQHNDHVFRIDRRDGDPWIARVFPPARPKAAVEGDAAILRFLERQGYPAERLAVEAAVSELDGASVLVTRFVDGGPLPAGTENLAMMGDLYGRLHALTPDDTVTRPGGASGDDPNRAGSPRQDLLAALSFLDAVDTKVPKAHRERFEQLREQVRSADDGHGLPEALLHGNLLHNPDHALVTDQGPVAINWKSAGLGPRLADFAYLMWGAPWNKNGDGVGAAAGAYRQHIELTDEEFDRLEAVMYIRPLYLTCFDYRRSIENGHQPDGSEWWWGFIDPEHIKAAAAATRTALRR